MKKMLIICTVLLFTVGNVWAQQNAGKVAHPFTKNSMPSAITTIKLTKSLSLSMQTTAVSSLVDIDAALVAGANYLKHAQADITEDNAGNGDPDIPDDPDDGGWDWKLTSPNFTHSTVASRTNLYGATAQGLYYAYLETGDATYMTAMQDAATVMIGNPNIRSAADLIFLMKFQDLSGVTPDIYKNAAKTKHDARIAGASPATATGFAEYIRDFRASQGYENGIIPWDIGAWAVAAQMLYDRFGGTYDLDADDFAEVLYQDSYEQYPFGYFDLTTDKNNGWDPTYTNKDYYWYSLGISGLIDAFESANVHTADIPGLVAILLDCQYPEGGFSYSYGANPDDEDWQSTAYAVMSLARVDQVSYQENINNACLWIGSTQDASSGGWVYGSSGNHYPEVGGESTAALYFFRNPIDMKQDVRDDLEVLLPTGDKKDNGLIDKAIKHIDRSLDSDLWIDPSHLTAKGKKVFEEEKKAVHELMKVKNLAVSDAILTLVEADRMLAQTAIDEAVDGKDKEKAEVEMGKALDEIGKDNFDKTVEHYKQAWHHATKAVNSLAKYSALEDSQLEDSAVPDAFGLVQNYPNPFNPTTLISYNLPEASQVTLTVYDMMGRQVKALVQEFQPAGNHSVIWNATNDNGTRMSGGIYFYQIKAGSFLKTHKMILLK